MVHIMSALLFFAFLGFDEPVEKRDELAGSAAAVQSVSPSKQLLTAQRFEVEQLPVSPEKRDQLYAMCQELRKGVVLIGTHAPTERTEDTDLRGMGFVVSTKRRLIATAGHAADDFSRGEPMFVVLDGASELSRVERVWYHPGITRHLDDGLHVRSSDPRDGEIAMDGPDVAVLRLSNSGPALPYQVELCTADELGGLQGQSIGLLTLGDESRWPTPPRRTSATFSVSGVSKMTGFDTLSVVPLAQRRSLRFVCDLREGSSGGPVFINNGHVAGIVYAGEGPLRGGCRSSAIRVDTLRELLAYHHLDDGRTWTASRPDWGPDPRLDQLRGAVKLVREAIRLREGKQYKLAYEKCSEALGVAPEYGRAWLERSTVSFKSLQDHWEELSDEERIHYADRCYEDSRRCIELYPMWNSACLAFAQGIVHRAYCRSDTSGYKIALAETDTMLRRSWPYHPLTDEDRAFLFSVRAHAHLYLRELGHAERDFNESIRLAPDIAGFYLDRAEYWEGCGRDNLAKADRDRARVLSKKPSRSTSDGKTTKLPPLVLPDDSVDPFAELPK